MRIALMTLGTRGDIHPIVALGAQLRRRGHQVRLGLSVNLVDVAHRLGLDAVPMGWDTQRLIESPQGRAWVSTGDAEAFSRAMYALTAEYEQQVDAEAIAVCEGADAIVAGVLLESRAAVLSEATGAALVTHDCFPRRINGVVPHPLVHIDPLPTEAANRATYLSYARLNRAHAQAQVDGFRERLGQRPRAATLTARRPLELQAYSPTLVPGLSWDRYRPFVGDLRMEPAEQARLGGLRLDPELDAWLADGAPPAFLTFGSTFTADPAAMLDAVRRVCRAVGVRALVATGWGLAAAPPTDPALRVVSYVDYDLVLPRCALVVHHGSASITAAGVRAGLPTMVCSSFFDQPFWGAQLQRLGIGVHVRFAELTEEVLRAGMARLRQPELRERAARYGRMLRAEPPGTPTAADRIEEYLTGR